jgi:hypothetical protein
MIRATLAVIAAMEVQIAYQRAALERLMSEA